MLTCTVTSRLLSRLMVSVKVASAPSVTAAPAVTDTSGGSSSWTAPVVALVSVSALPASSVKVTFTLMYLPSSAATRV